MTRSENPPYAPRCPKISIRGGGCQKLSILGSKRIIYISQGSVNFFRIPDNARNPQDISRISESVGFLGILKILKVFPVSVNYLMFIDIINLLRIPPISTDPTDPCE